MYYYGEYRVALDDKGRLRIPNKLKTQLGAGGVTIFAGTDDTLFLMSQEQFGKRITELAEDTLMSEFDKQNALRVISSSVCEPEEDAQGRFVLPMKLREHARINKKVVFLGAITRVEIWGEEEYDSRFGKKLDINSAVAKLGL